MVLIGFCLRGQQPFIEWDILLPLSSCWLLCFVEHVALMYFHQALYLNILSFQRFVRMLGLHYQLGVWIVGSDRFSVEISLSIDLLSLKKHLYSMVLNLLNFIDETSQIVLKKKLTKLIPLACFGCFYQFWVNRIKICCTFTYSWVFGLTCAYLN